LCFYQTASSRLERRVFGRVTDNRRLHQVPRVKVMIADYDLYFPFALHIILNIYIYIYTRFKWALYYTNYTHTHTHTHTRTQRYAVCRTRGFRNVRHTQYIYNIQRIKYHCEYYYCFCGSSVIYERIILVKCLVFR